jgi:hypothetical protein
VKLPGLHFGDATLVHIKIGSDARVELAIHDPKLNDDGVFEGEFMAWYALLSHITGPLHGPEQLDMPPLADRIRL